MWGTSQSSGERRLAWGRCLLALVLLFSPLLLAAVESSEPAEIADLRMSESRSAKELRAHAIGLRDASTDQRVRAWANLAVAEFENDLEEADAALTRLEEVLAEAQALGLMDLEFEALSRKATILVNRGRSDETAVVLEQAKNLLDASDDPRWRAQWLHNKGVLERKLGKFADAERYFQQAMDELRALGDNLGVAGELNSIGMLHGRTGRFSDALLAHREALQLARKSADPGEIARSLRLLGVLHRNLDDEEMGSRYLQEALEYVEQRNTREAITLHGELTKSLLLLDRIDEADASAARAVAMAEPSGSPPNRVSAYTRMAEVRLAQGRFDEASTWSDRAFEQFDQVAFRDQILLRMTRALVLAGRGEAAAALVEADAVVSATRKLGDRILERAALGLLADQQLIAGDAAAAFVTLKAYQSLDKALAIDLAARRIAMLEGSLESERSAAEKALLERDNAIQALTLNRQRWLGFALISGLAILLGFAILLFRRARAADRRRQQMVTSRDELARLNTALLDSTSELERVAHSDALTGLANRHALAAELSGRLTQAQTSGEPLSALILDVDHFKQLNDREGHLAGDAALREIGTRLRKALRGDSALGRWGGEEFLAIFSRCRHDEALAAADRLRRAIADTAFVIDGKTLSITVSVGVATAYPPHLSSIDPLLAAADSALYCAKRGGRNRVEGALLVADAH